MHDVVLIQDNKIIYANKQLEEIADHSLKDSGGVDMTILSSCINECDRQRISELYQAHCRGDFSNSSYEFDLIQADGGTRSVEIHAYPAEYDGRPAIQAVIIDRTRQKLIEKALKESEDRFKSMFVNAPLAYQSLDESGRILIVNRAWLDTFGYANEDEVIGRYMAEFMPLGDDALFDSYYNHLKTSDEISNAEFQLKRRDGGLIYTQIFCRVQRDPDSHFQQSHCVIKDITRSKLAEQARLKAENEKSAILNTMSGTLIYCDTDLKILWANKATAEIIGCSTTELQGKYCYAVWCKGDRPCDGCPVLRALKTGEAQDAELTVLGGGIWHLKGYPVKNESGEIIGLLEFGRNVTEQKLANEKIRAERDRAQQYLDIAGTILVALDNDGRVTLLNKRGCEALSLNEKDIIGRNWFDTVVPVGDRKETVAAFKKIIQGDIETYTYYENYLLTADGKERLFAWHNIHLRDAAGEIIGTLSSGEDITERKTAGEELRKSEERFRTLIETMNDGLLLVDEKLQIAYVNKRLTELLGISAEAVEMTSIFEYLDKENADILNKQWAIRKHGGSAPYELEWVRKDGAKIATIISPKPVIDAKGFFKGSLGVVTDITGRKEAEILNKAKTQLVEDLRKTDDINLSLKSGCRAMQNARLFKHSVCVLYNQNGKNMIIECAGLTKNDLSHIKNTLLSDLNALNPGRLKTYCLGNSYLIPNNFDPKSHTDLNSSDSKPDGNSASALNLSGERLLVPLKDGLTDYSGWLLAYAPYQGIKLDSAIVNFVEEIAEIVAKKINEIQFLEKLQTERKHLKEKNVALREVLAHIEEEKIQIRQKMVDVIDKSLLPALARLINSDGKVNQSYYDYLLNSMKEMVKSSGGQKQLYGRLSPREVEICNLIKGGSSSKEIAEALHLAIATIQKHRERIRSKLGLANKNVNLISYLKNPN